MSLVQRAQPQARPQNRAPFLFSQGDTVANILVGLFLVGALQVASMIMPPYLAPSPLAILNQLWTTVLPVWPEILITLLRLAASLFFAMFVGTLLGLIMGMVASVRPFIRALIVIDTGIPALSWMLIAVFWFRQPEVRIFFILSVIVIPFYALSVHDAIRALPKDWLEMCESFRPTRLQTLRYLILPHIVAYVFSTTRSVIGYATRMVIFAELIASAVGVGAQMGFAQATFNIAAVFAWTLLLVIFSVVSQKLVGFLEGRALSYRPEVEVRK